MPARTGNISTGVGTKQPAQGYPEIDWLSIELELQAFVHDDNTPVCAKVMRSKLMHADLISHFMWITLVLLLNSCLIVERGANNAKVISSRLIRADFTFYVD